MSTKIKNKIMEYVHLTIIFRFIFILTLFGLTQLGAFMVITTYFKTTTMIFQIGLIAISNFAFYRVIRSLKLL